MFQDDGAGQLGSDQRSGSMWPVHKSSRSCPIGRLIVRPYCADSVVGGAMPWALCGYGAMLPCLCLFWHFGHERVVHGSEVQIHRVPATSIAAS
jgi:hypothetical protein